MIETSKYTVCRRYPTWNTNINLVINRCQASVVLQLLISTQIICQLV